LDLTKFLDKAVTVKFNGGREVTGILKGWDPLVNLVLDQAVESLRDPEDVYKPSGQTRNLGLVVCRGTAVMLIHPVEGTEEIANPFTQPEGS
jgi:U6 snRNA-associated Sm-like protein LSm7